MLGTFVVFVCEHGYVEVGTGRKVTTKPRDRASCLTCVVTASIGPRPCDLMFARFRQKLVDPSRL